MSTGPDLELGPGQPGPVDGRGKSTKIPVAKDRRLHNIDRFVVETFENRASEIFVRIDDQNDWSTFTRNCSRSTENQTGKISRDNGVCSNGRHDRSQIDMPPIRA